MDAALAYYDPLILAAAAAFMALGGFVKGAVGFALPMVALGGLGSVMGAQEAIGILILPMAVSNIWQTFRQGVGAAAATFGDFWRLNVVMGFTIAVVAQLVPSLPDSVLFTFLGIVVALGAALQLAGWQPQAPAEGSKRHAIEILTALIAGIAGGLSGIWGPPILFFLLSLSTPKTIQIRAQGIAFLVGSVVLVGAHLESGVLNEVTVPVGLMMIVPVGLGMWLGLRFQDRIDHRLFRRITLAVLTLAGMNLLRRGLF